jgi:hypothetical protein
VKTSYYGSEERGSIVAELDSIDRLEKAAEREELQAERKESDAEERAIAEWFDDVQSLADAAMVVAGFHKHRGQWRRKRR